MALIERVAATLARSPEDEYVRKVGRVCRVVGLMIESNGPSAFVGERCLIELPAGQSVEAEVVGFNEERVLLMPYGETTQIAPGCIVKGTGRMLQVPVGFELIGQVLDGLGRPLSGEAPATVKRYDVLRKPPNPLERPRILDSLSTGVRIIDGLLTVGKGQRVGLFAGSGVGKSTLLGMIAKRSSADINVIALIGERGREVKDRKSVV